MQAPKLEQSAQALSPIVASFFIYVYFTLAISYCECVEQYVWMAVLNILSWMVLTQLWLTSTAISFMIYNAMAPTQDE